MRLVLALIAIALGSGALTLGGPRAARAQGLGMNCYANTGGRSNCGLAANALMNRLADAQRDRHPTESRHLEEVRRVDEALKSGQCVDAVTLAHRSGDALLATSTERICAARQAHEPPAG